MTDIMTKADRIVAAHRANPMMTHEELAAETGYSSSYVRTVDQRHSLNLPVKATIWERRRVLSLLAEARKGLGNVLTDRGADNIFERLQRDIESGRRI